MATLKTSQWLLQFTILLLMYSVLVCQMVIMILDFLALQISQFTMLSRLTHLKINHILCTKTQTLRDEFTPTLVGYSRRPSNRNGWSCLSSNNIGSFVQSVVPLNLGDLKPVGLAVFGTPRVLFAQ